MPNTPNWNIYYPDGATKPEMDTVIAGTASSVETALDNIVDARPLGNYVVANTTALNAIAGMQAGETAWQADEQTLWIWNGTVWQDLYTVDTGWVTLPYASGFKQGSSGGPLQYRVKNGIMTVMGGVINDAGAMTPGTEYTVAASGSIPAGYQPPQNITGGADGNSGRGGTMTVATNGAVAFRPSAGNPANVTTFMRGSVSYPI